MMEATKMKKMVFLVLGSFLIGTMLSGCILPVRTTSSQAGSSVAASSDGTSSGSGSSDVASSALTSSEAVSSEISSSEPAATPTGSTSTDGPSLLTGTFQSIEWGDYLHLQMLGDDNVEYSFFVLTYVGVDPESLTAGQRIRVTWQTVTKFLDPPGSDVTFDEITLIELADPS
jgi:hypothetical protein